MVTNSGQPPPDALASDARRSRREPPAPNRPRGPSHGPPPTSSPIAFAWMAASALLFATMNFLARVASGHAPWTMVAAVRALVGALVAIAVAKARRAPMRVRDTRGMWGRSAWGTAAMLCTFFAVGHAALPLGDAVTLLNLTPVFLAVLAPFLIAERAGRRVAIALPPSLAGVVLVVKPTFLAAILSPSAVATGRDARSPEALFVAAVAASGALCSCFAMAKLRTIGPRESPEAIAIHFSLTAAAVCGLLALPTLIVPSLGDAASMLGAGVCAGLAQLCMTRAYALERAARVSGLGYLSVVASALLGAVALHEIPDALSVIGMALVITGGLVVTVAGLRDVRASTARAPLSSERPPR